MNNKDKAVDQPTGDLPPLPEPLDIDWPELNSHALGCGVEDRGIRDRYAAAEYGWDNGFSRAVEAVPDEIYSADQMQDYARAAIAAHLPQQPKAEQLNDQLLAFEAVCPEIYTDPERELLWKGWQLCATHLAKEPKAEQPVIKTWQERATFLPLLHKPSTPVEEAMAAEIADLRAHLARQAQAEPVAEFIEDTKMAGGARFRLLKPLSVGAKLYTAPVAPAGAQNAPNEVKQGSVQATPVGMVAKATFGNHKILVPLGDLENVELGAKVYLASIRHRGEPTLSTTLTGVQRHTWASINERMIGKHHDDTGTEYVILADAEAAIRAAMNTTDSTVTASAGAQNAEAIRNQAYEAAANVCEAMYRNDEGGAGCAVACDRIRALKVQTGTANTQEGGGHA